MEDPQRPLPGERSCTRALHSLISRLFPQIIKSDDPEKKAVAEFHPHQRHFFVFRMSKHAFFEVQPIPEIVEAIDKFIGMPFYLRDMTTADFFHFSVSYLLVERRRRDSRIRVKLERH